MKALLFILLFAIGIQAQDYNSNRIYKWHWASDTVSTADAIDTLSLKLDATNLYTNMGSFFTIWWGASIITDDTIEISSSASFPQGRTIVYVSNDAEGAMYVGPMMISSNTETRNLYIRRYSVSGGAGTPRWKAFVGGY